ncbi:TPA: hypothetical protein ACH3X1_016430 [Trebouxia sp. C0004]
MQELRATSFVHEVAELVVRYQLDRAKPLKFNPAADQYYSLHEQDKVFGANTDAYSKKRGGSLRSKPAARRKGNGEGSEMGNF